MGKVLADAVLELGQPMVDVMKPTQLFRWYAFDRKPKPCPRCEKRREDQRIRMKERRGRKLRPMNPKPDRPPGL